MTITTDYTHVIAQPGKLFSIDAINPATGRTYIAGETLAEVQLRYPGAELVPWQELSERRRTLALTPPVEIDRDRWWYLLEVLPPEDWTHRGGAETFKLSERTTDDITLCCVRIGKRYFSCQRPDSTTHEALVQLVLAAFPDAR